MKKLCLILILFVVWTPVFSQERYYSDISVKAEANHIIDLFETKNHPEGGLNFEIQSLTLLKSRKGFRVQSIRKLEMADELIFITDISNTSLFIYDLQGEAKKKIDITNYEKRAWITDYAVYKDTIYIVDNERLFLFKFTTKGDFLSKELLTFNFEDFLVNKQGLYFISKHEVNSKKNTVRINVFDHSLNLLKQHFVSGGKNDLFTLPRFFLGENDEVLFAVEHNNEVLKLNKESAFKFLRIKNADVLFSFVDVLGLHSFMASRDHKRSEEPLWKSYVKKDAMKSIRFETFGSNDLSILLQNNEDCGIYQDNFVSYFDFNEPSFLRSIPDMNWSPENSNLKMDFFEKMEQINDNQHHVVVLYKIIDNSPLTE
jgi:hypothetical protein